MRPTPPPAPPLGSARVRLLNVLTGFHVWLLRVSRGRLGRRLVGVPILILHHRGRRSGELRETPLMYLRDGDNVVIVGSRGGSRQHPAWWLNLREAGEGEIELDGVRRHVRPRLAQGEERARLWPQLVELYPDYGVYATRTDREIPVIVLEPAPEPAPIG
jgi:deazaflavin-dependent oxidoreductase (nitroreductase family)